jgi:hypothetical protein
MADETREERVKRIAAKVLEDLSIDRIAAVEPMGGDRTERWAVIIYGEHVVRVPFDLHPSDDVMRRELRKSVRNALGH